MCAVLGFVQRVPAGEARGSCHSASRSVRGLLELLRLTLGVDFGLWGASRGDLDPARFQSLRNFSLELDYKQPVLEGRSRDLHVVGKVEGLPE